MGISVKPCVIIIKDNNVLCLKVKYKEEFYLFPDGGIEEGESLAECAIREAKEETGLDIELGKIVYVNDYIQDADNRVLNVFFLGSVRRGCCHQE